MKTAQTGIERIIPSNNDAARQAKKPPIAKPIFPLTAPAIAGTAPTTAPVAMAPIITPSI
ncbi:MAG: hypothetical protein J6W49_02300 [Paludibacteraceae bacterium]|nr:hypothetical protein [Paludibacteraceae bacterium]MBP5742257.1 hypothetical protein [Paludibacteraceae bacterium]